MPTEEGERKSTISLLSGLSGMKIYRLEKKVILKSDMDTVWDFFSSPLNLNEITPPDMSFEILSDLKGLKMYPGMIINYKVRPFLNIPLRWTTEITHCEEGHYFVDEQRFGPYSFWHHKHFFKKVECGIEMTDIVDYGLPMGMLGQIANSIYVEQKLQGIFNYRNEIVHKLFTK
jgi:ligand-binding SRPBCC domain-containing protein